MLIYAIAILGNDKDIYHYSNAILPAVLGILCIIAGYWSVKRNKFAFWTSYPWFFAAWALYYGFGPLAYIYGNKETIAYMNELYPVGEDDLLKTNLLNVVVLIAILIGVILFSKIKIVSNRHSHSEEKHSPLRVAILFLAIGIPIKYLFELPYALQLTDYTLPGTVQYLGSFSSMAIVPLTVAKDQKRKGAKVIFWLLFISELFVALITLAKINVIMFFILVLMGQYFIRANIKQLIHYAVFLILGYVFFLSPFVNFGRYYLQRNSPRDINEFITIIKSYIDNKKKGYENYPGLQMWWSRLCYSNTQTFAMSQYDRGKQGDTFQKAIYTVIPRFIYPEKPALIFGQDFTYLIKRSRTSFTGVGIAGEAYWNGGWIAVLIVGIYLGLFFTILSKISIYTVKNEKYLYFPVAYLTILSALRPDDWFVGTYFGNIIIVGAVVVILKIFFLPYVRNSKEIYQ
jgi:hypothetical protein